MLQYKTVPVLAASIKRYVAVTCTKYWQGQDSSSLKGSSRTQVRANHGCEPKIRGPMLVVLIVRIILYLAYFGAPYSWKPPCVLSALRPQLGLEPGALGGRGSLQCSELLGRQLLLERS